MLDGDDGSVSTDSPQDVSISDCTIRVFRSICDNHFHILYKIQILYM